MEFLRLVMAKAVEVAFAKMLAPVQVLLLESKLEDAAVMVKVPPGVMAVVLMVASVPVRKLVPILLVPTTEPLALVERMEFGRLVMAKAVEVPLVSVRLVIHAVVEVKSVEVALLKMSRPEKVLLLESKLEDAA